jgi:hypothetical protein
MTPFSTSTSTSTSATSATNLPTPTNTNINTNPTTFPSTSPLDVNINTYDQFNDLDHLFDGFFDLSMPTIFQDPLFDGDAFLNANLDFEAHEVDGDGLAVWR